MAEPVHSTDTAYEFTATAQVPQESHGDVDPMEISGQMVIWTWVVFAIVLIVLYKVAWKPILNVLDQREKDIQDSIDNSARIREELASIEKKRSEIIGEADEKAKSVLDAARKGAREQARIIEAKARDEAQILMENASREIETSRAKAEDSLRTESAAWARQLAGKLIEANLDDEKNRALTDRLIQEL